MMTNREKYPKIDDALAAFKKHKEECKCDCTFDKWLGQPCDEEIKFGMLSLAGILAEALVADALEKGLAGTPKTVADENADIECPLCHKKNGRIRDVVLQHFACPDCKAVISNCEIESDNDAFRKWFSQFNKKQD